MGEMKLEVESSESYLNTYSKGIESIGYIGHSPVLRCYGGSEHNSTDSGEDLP